jgi:hypothetical protein
MEDETKAVAADKAALERRETADRLKTQERLRGMARWKAERRK